jgi:pre-rRNA-processing protein TSR2
VWALVLFARLEHWPALRVAVEQGWGGPSSHDKWHWLASEIVDAFDSSSNDDSTLMPDAE